METESSAAPRKALPRRQPISLLDMRVKKWTATCVVPCLHQIFLRHALDFRRTNGRHAYQVLKRGNVLRAVWHQVTAASRHPFAPRRRPREDMRRRSALELGLRRRSGNWRETYVNPSLPNDKAQPTRNRAAVERLTGALCLATLLKPECDLMGGSYPLLQFDFLIEVFK